MNELLTVLLILVVFYIIYLYVRKVETYDDPKLKDIHDKLIKIDPRAEFISLLGSSQSFTEDKIRTYMCLRDEQGNYYDDNMLMYVAIHELAHVNSKSVDPDHKTDEFKDNFKLLLKKAEDLGLYDPKLPLNYKYCPNTPEIEATNGGKSTPKGVVEVNK